MLSTYTFRAARSLAPDGNFSNRAPWYMFRNYDRHPCFRALSVDIKPLARQFMKDGFLVIENAVPDALCDELTREFRTFTRSHGDYFDGFRDEYGLLQRVVNLHLVMPSLVKLFSRSEKVLRFQDAAFGAPSSIYTSLYFERGSTQEIHRDSPYFCTRPEYNYFGTWFALEDSTLENGCLEVMRGGHLIPEIDRTAFAAQLYGAQENVPAFADDIFHLYQTEIARQCATGGYVKESVPLKKGSVLIWHPQLPHGGGPIIAPGLSRNSVVMHTAPLGMPVYQADIFFNPRRRMSEKAHWSYKEVEGRGYAAHPLVDIQHVAPRLAESFA